jgi:anaerobic ribonucleoside-triphosphate reductase
LISFNTFNGKNLIVTSDHPFITLDAEKKMIICPECKSDDVIKNRTSITGKDYFKCKSCNHGFGSLKEAQPDTTKRNEVYAEEIKLNNYAITPTFKLDTSYNSPISIEDSWFIGMFIAEGYYKSTYLAFEMSDSIELRKLIDYLTVRNIEFNLNYSASSGLQLLQEMNIITINVKMLPLEIQSLITQIRPYSQNKNMPVTMLSLNPKIIGAMVSGVVDGDGVVRNDDEWVSRVNLRMTSKTLLSQIQFWLDTQEIKSSLLTIDSYGERQYKNLTIRPGKQLYSLTFYIPEDKRQLFSECLKIDNHFKFSHMEYEPRTCSDFRKIEVMQNDDDYVYDITTATNTFICNGILSHNCAGWSLRQILEEGFNGVPGKVAAKPSKHFNAALGQVVNFFGTLQNEWAGAQALNSFDTYLAPLVANDKLDYVHVKQAMQEFIFGINQTSRWGNQVPFTNLTFDWVVPEDMADQKAMVGGKRIERTYKEFQKEMDMINKAFMEIMMEGDMDHRIFTFPIPTYNITQDFDWESENAKLLFEMTSKYGTPYFQNFINSSLKPGDVRSMCCRLQLDVRELKSKTGGLFGAGEQTGSIGVVTINLPRIGYLSKTEEDFFKRLGHLMGLAKESLEIKRKDVTKNMINGLLPYSKRYLGTLANHFSTIGINGMHECCLNFLGKGIETKEGKKFAIKVLDFMRDKLQNFQQETGNIYNLEATPAEGTSYRLAKHDKKRYPGIITSGNDKNPYYTNSSQLPVNHTIDIFEALKHQDELQCKYTGGTVLHGFIGEKISDWKVCRELVRKIAYNFKLPYFTITPTFSICPVHGYISGEHQICPHDHTQDEIERYGVEEERIREIML